jgi:hypothetical protein
MFVEPGYRLVFMSLVNLAEYEGGVPATTEARECSDGESLAEAVCNLNEGAGYPARNRRRS